MPNVILVGFAPEKSAGDRDAVAAAYGGVVVHRYRHIAVDVVQLPDSVEPGAKAAAMAQADGVRFAEQNAMVDGAAAPDDARFGEQWALNNTGQSGGTSGADIHALDAWNLAAGGASVVVAIIDSGIDYNHEDLAGAIWTNDAEAAGTAGVDDDGDGVVDDIHGARWTNGNGTPTSGDPMDGNGHGTHVAGIIGAVRNNAIGVAGVCPTVKLMALRFKDSTNNGTIADAISAIEYAIDKKARLSNNSYRFTTYSQAFKEAIQAAADAGQLFVAASANAGVNNDVTPSFPCAFDCPNILGVAASDRYDLKPEFSNWGFATVDLAAPGADILSLQPGNGYLVMSGSSMSAAFASGVAALLASLHADATPATLKQWIMESADPLPAWEGLTRTGGRLNAANAVALAGSGR